MHRHPIAWRRCGVIVLALSAVLARSGEARADEGVASAATRYPVHSWRLDAPIVATGAVALAASFLVERDHDPVPPEGRDPSAIPWGIDRGIIGNRNEHADNLSNWTRNAMLLYPAAVAYAGGADGERLAAVRDRLGLWAEAYLLSQGTVRFGKTAIGRGRPFTYLPEADRPDTAPYDVSAARADHGLPSGHSATVWTAVGLAVTEDLLTRPDAGGWERFSVGFLGGALAGTTSVLRVQAGQHFPTDVIAGSALGATIGVTVPLLHRGGRAMPSRRGWLTALAGTATGALVGGWAASAI